jgi:APA family basic amino acid/polyamine antiporter
MTKRGGGGEVEEKEEESGLKRNVNLFQAVMYGVGLILGAGIYVLIGDVAGIAGNAMWISFIVAAVIATFTGLSYAELSSMFPKSAADYVYVKNAFGSNTAAFIAGWLIIFVAIVSAAAVAIGFSGYFSSLFPQFHPLLSAAGLVLILSVVNFVGIRESVWMNTTFTFIELAGLAIIILAAILFGSHQIDYFEMPPAVAEMSMSAGAIVAASSLIFFAYYGFENLANIAEETKNASKVIPKALIISIAVTTAVYILVALSAITLLGWEELSSSEAPLASAAERAFGKMGVFVLSTIALFATSNTVLMMLISGSRIMYGMSKGNALPGMLSKVHSQTKTPWIAIIVTMLVTIGVVSFSQGSISAVANIAVFDVFIAYAFVNFALIWLRYKKPKLERPFQSPIRIGRFPLIAGLGLATSVAMLSQFDYGIMLAGAIATASGFVAHIAVEKYKKTTKSSESRERVTGDDEH